MENMGLGLQLYSVREEFARDEFATLRRVAEMGYKQVELCAPDYQNDRLIPVHGAKESKKVYDDLGLRRLSIAMAVNFHRDLDDWKQLADYSSEVGCEGICCSVATFQDGDEARRLADFFNEVGRIAVENGQRFYYHNHYHEFQNIRGEVPMDILVENTDADLVDFELDTFWTLRGGVEPIAYMDRLGERLKLVHQKDLSAGFAPVNLFDVIPEGMNLDWDGFAKYAHNPAAFAELGLGCMDVSAIVAKAKAMPSVISMVVEQDESAIGAMQSAQINYDYLKKLI